MSSDYPGSGYPPRQPLEPQQGAGWQPNYPGNRDYSEMPPPVSSPSPQQSNGYTPSSVSSPEAPPAKRPRWLIPVMVAALVLVVCAVVGGVVYAIGQNALQEPLSTTSTFCNDLKAQKYSDAYGLLSAGYQKAVSSTEFTQISQLHDQLDGKVHGCGLAGIQSGGGFNLNLNPQTASFNAQITRNHSYTGAISLVKQNGNWKIDAVDESLQGSDVGALTTGAQFCQALAAQNYQAVYAMFTPAYQQQIGTVDKYVNGLKQVFGGGQFQITGCQPQINTYTVTAQGDDASVSGAFDIKVTTDAGALTVPVPFKIAFAKISGTWKISDLEVVQSQG